jgi:hypothetical protein
LANPQKVKDFVDFYTNLALAVCRIARHVPDPHVAVAARMLAELFKTLADVLKALGAEALDDRVVPGLAAMNPEGTFITDLNAVAPAMLPCYHAITSEFDGIAALGSIEQNGMVEALVQAMAAGLSSQLLGTPNDLVVNTPYMSVAGPGPGMEIACAYRSNNGIVHHLNYFLQGGTIDALSQGLGIEEAD